MKGKNSFYPIMRDIEHEGKLVGFSDELIIANIFESYLDNRNLYKESPLDVFTDIILHCDLDYELVKSFCEKNNLLIETKETIHNSKEYFDDSLAFLLAEVDNA